MATRASFFTKENENNHHLTVVPPSSLILLVSLAFIFFLYPQQLNILIVKSSGQATCNRLTDTKDFISGAVDHFIFEKLM